MKRKLVLLLSALFLAFIPVQACAADFTWELQWYDNNEIYERVTVPGTENELNTDEWQAVSPGDNTVLERETGSWDEYDQLKDRLPIQNHTRNFLLYKIITLELNTPDLESFSTFNTLLKNQGTVTIEVPGFINESSATSTASLKNGMTAAWELKGSDDLKANPLYLKVVTLQTLPILLTILIIGFGAVMVVYIRQIRRINKIIEEEYSLDNLLAELREEETEKEDEENDGSWV